MCVCLSPAYRLFARTIRFHLNMQKKKYKEIIINTDHVREFAEHRWRSTQNVPGQWHRCHFCVFGACWKRKYIQYIKFVATNNTAGSLGNKPHELFYSWVFLPVSTLRPPSRGGNGVGTGAAVVVLGVVTIVGFGRRGVVLQMTNSEWNLFAWIKRKRERERDSSPIGLIPKYIIIEHACTMDIYTPGWIEWYSVNINR